MQSPDRMLRLRTAMKAQGIDLLALAPGSHLEWLAGFSPHPDERACLLLVGTERAAFLMPSLNAEEARKHSQLPFCTWADAEGPTQALQASLAAAGGAGAKRVALDEAMRADIALLLLGALPGAAHTFTDGTLGKARMQKDPSEVQALLASAHIADEAMRAAFAGLRPGVSELEIAKVVRDGFSARGATPLFEIVASGPNGAFPHHGASARKLQVGDAVVIDIGGRKDRFPSDITRMAVLGHPPEGYAEVHAVVERAVQAALAAVRPGVEAKEVDAAARGVIAAAGYGEYFVHRTGHGLGLDLHEPPYLTATSKTVLNEGMTFSIEPGIYLPGRFGIRLEEIVVVRARGAEVFSRLPREVFVSPA